MCGIAGTLNLTPGESPAEDILRRMVAMLRHRGPDEFGIYRDARIGLGSARLSIIDLSGGQQPISNEDGSMWIVFNGEIFNHVELRPELESRGHRFSTHSDTEVLLHLYEEYGPRCLSRLNGQFAFAIWNSADQTLFMARDRLGVRPLFYTRRGGRLVFASEIKAILTASCGGAEIDPVALDQIFTFWSPLSPRTVFKDIVELPPGHCLQTRGGEIGIEPYWQLDFPDETGLLAARRRTDADYLAEFESLLVDAARIRLRADVPVGAYLSGGLDSSAIAAIVRTCSHNHLDTFSIAFSDARFDESQYQRQMARFLGTSHQVVYATEADIGRVFPDVIWHTETPLMRTSPAPMFLLSRLVRDCGYKVVLTGEGADEFLAGYDIFKEAKVRRFWASQPASKWRPLLLKRLYPDIAELGQTHPAFLAAFFKSGLTEVDRPEYSHAVRWRNNRRTTRFFSADLRARLAELRVAALDQVAYPARFMRWGPLARAQFLEISIFLPQYLLSSQGDRMTMAHSVEGRFPFLDHRLVEFCNDLPVGMKLRRLSEKYVLRQFARRLLPPEILQRPKRPYRAPIHTCFLGDKPQPYAEELLSPERVRQAGWFKPEAVSALAAKLRRNTPLGETDDMALAGILSTQLVQHQFLDHFKIKPPLDGRDRVKVVRRGHRRGSVPD